VINHFPTMNSDVFPFILGDYFFPLPLICRLLFFHFVAVRIDGKSRVKSLRYGLGQHIGYCPLISSRRSLNLSIYSIRQS